MTLPMMHLGTALAIRSFGDLCLCRFVYPGAGATAFHLIWPHTHAAGVVDAWQAWAPNRPDELAASLLLTAPGHIDRPPVVNLFGAMIGTESDTTELLDELVTRVGADPTSAFRNQMSYRETKRYLAELGDAMAGDDDRLGEASRGEPSAEGHPYSKSEFFRRPLPAEAIAALVEHLAKERVPGQSCELDLTPWGGSYNRVPADATAFAHRDELFLLQHTVIVDPRHFDRRQGGRTALAGALVGVDPSVGDWRRVPELPRPGPRRLGTRLLRDQLRPSGTRQSEVRSGPFLQLPPIYPESSSGKRCIDLKARR
jgi:hypothetical protein